jgi:UDP-N-acetylglucosamine transferase subunit ALG13
VIFVTVGTQLTFDRMVERVDAWASRSGEEVFAQVGETSRDYTNLTTAAFLPPEEAKRRFREARCIVAHAGMGTILSALGMRKPLVIMPRKAELGEHRNDHQIATARRLEERGLVTVAWDGDQLEEMLERLADVEVGPAIPEQASPELLDAVRHFLAS